MSHGHHHHHHHGSDDASSLPPALDMSVPDEELTPSQFSRRSMLRRTGLLGAGLAAGSVLVSAGQAAATPASTVSRGG
ncbi:histidinol-phosphatase, partial [Streptomyces chiangmaiensis]|nr:histidinol-phosphatase [Streptomyces chiangmaiensis]